MIKAVGYMRCSGKGQLSGDTWERQHDTISKFAAANGYEVVTEYREEGVPGKTDEEGRPAFQEMIATLLGNGACTIIVESLDRLAREYRVQEQLVIYIASKELSLIAANTGENITDAMMGDPMRRAMVQIQGIFAELDKNLTVAKLRKARERKRNAGKRVEGVKPFGTLEGEAGTLNRIFHMKAEGYSLAMIALRLNEWKIPTRTGRTWSIGTIGKILSRADAANDTRRICASDVQIEIDKRLS